MKKTQAKTKNIAVLGLFTAIIVVFQLLSYGLTAMGVFPLSLVLIPIVLGAYLYGAGAGAILGAAFGIVVTVCCFMGLDKGGYVLISANPYITTAICIVKGAAAGAIAGLVALPFKKTHPTLAIILAAIVAPIVNTGLFVFGVLVFFKDILYSWSGGTDLTLYVITGLVGINFLVEFTINVVAAPFMKRVEKAMKKA